MASLVEEAKKLWDKGLVEIVAYWCKRCNYVWLPKDFDINQAEEEYQLLKREPPKSCARCKSKYWNEYPKRKTKHSYDEGDGFLNHGRDTSKRKNAYVRRLIRTYTKIKNRIAEDDKQIKYLENELKERGIKLED